MKQTIAALQDLMTIGWCARRREPSVTAMSKHDEGPTIKKPLPPVIDNQTLATEAPISVPVSSKLKPASDVEKKADKIQTKKASTLGPVVAKCLPSKKQQLNPAAKVFMPPKVTSNIDESTTAGSGDLTEDDRFYDSGPELVA